MTAITVLLEHGVKEKNILLLNVFATPKGDIHFGLFVFQILGQMLSTWFDFLFLCMLLCSLFETETKEMRYQT